MDKKLLTYKGSKKLMTMVGLLTIVQAAAIVFQAIFLAKAIVHMYNGAAWSAVLTSFSFFLLTFLIRNFLQWWKSRAAYQFADETSARFQEQLIRKLFELGPRAIGKQGSGHLVTLCMEGIPNFRTYLELFIPRFLAVLCIPTIFLTYVISIDVASGVILLVVLPILIAFLILIGMVAQKQKDAKWKSHQILSRHFVDSLRGLVTLKFLGKSKTHQESIGKVSHQYRKATLETLRLAFLSSFSLDFFSSLSVAVVAVELGLRLIEGNIGLEAALIILILAPEYFMPVRDLGSDYHATMDGKVAGTNIQKLLAMDGVTKQASFEKTVPRWGRESTLDVKGVSKVASEEENRSILDGVSFKVRGFQKIGIIGLSGAGKSTLIDILSGFSTISKGDIKLNGQPLGDLAQQNWQEQLTYIPQHPYIFSGTMRENIAWYAPEATEESVWKAIKTVGLLELVESLPDGLDEPIGQGGRVLSGGEEQRIALARAFLANKNVMLFDEPTAHLDIETEHEIKQVVLPLLENKLVFFATHRLHWMKNMDYILVLDKGKLVESGPEEELMERRGAYFRLVQAQQGGVEVEID